MSDDQHLGILFVRLHGRIVEAPAEDQEVLRGYASWPDKGAIVAEQRLTVMARKAAYWAGEAVRIVHVYEATAPGRLLYVMGPKPVYGESVDDLLASPVPPGSDPLSLDVYNGRVLPSPGLDSNFEITSYTFAEPGSTHRIVWKLGELVSNTLVIQITP